MFVVGNEKIISWIFVARAALSCHFSRGIFAKGTGGIHSVEVTRSNGSLFREPFEKFCGFVSKSYLFHSTIFGAFLCDSSKGFYEVGVLCAVHYVRGEGFGDVDELGCFVGVEVGLEVSSLADCCAGGFDRVVEEVCSLIVREVVCFLDFSREVVAEDLLEVLSVVGVCSFDVGESDGFHFGEFLSFSSILL